MKLFTKDPLDAARDSLTKLTQRLAAAESVIIEKKESTKRLAVDGADDNALDVAAAAVRAASDRVGTLTVAIREVENTISVLEAEQAAAADQKVRAATVIELEAIERDLTKAADDFVFSAKQLSAVATKMGAFMPDAVGLSVFAASAGSEIPPNVAMLKSLLRGYISGVISGGGRATLPQPAAPVPPPALPQAPKVEVIAIKNIAWSVDGKVKTSHPGHKVALSPEVASSALKIGACVEPQDPRAAFHAGQKKLTVPNIENCVGLDAESRAAIASAEPRGVVEPIRRSAPPGIADASRPLQQAASRALPLPPGFEPLDRGPAYTVRVPAGNPVPGQENDDES